MLRVSSARRELARRERDTNVRSAIGNHACGIGHVARERPIAFAKHPRALLELGGRMLHREPPDRAVIAREIDDDPHVEHGKRHRRDARENTLIIERR